MLTDARAATNGGGTERLGKVDTEVDSSWTQAKQAKVTPPGRAPTTTTSRLPDLAEGQTTLTTRIGRGREARRWAQNNETNWEHARSVQPHSGTSKATNLFPNTPAGEAVRRDVRAVDGEAVKESTGRETAQWTSRREALSPKGGGERRGHVGGRVGWNKKRSALHCWNMLTSGVAQTSTIRRTSGVEEAERLQAISGHAAALGILWDTARGIELIPTSG
ncbi:hypothetical protein OH76DRAFT_1419176 [Lentinus brumalis]|uniref:Uncharacterized protein n=1 Tax=Lentinus brumalis TaxID=2498619 RepID=A0A371D6L7_9APHY|nr:hypothetical protein OH76DRAFT_1419176 [Polyporus brumalis]